MDSTTTKEGAKTELWYLATPYTKFPYGLDYAAHDAAKIAAKLIADGENVFSPIVHSHLICHCAKLDPVNHDFWMRVDQAFMEKCDGLIVCMMTSWSRSKGMRKEIDYFKKAGKRIRYFDPETDKFVSEVLN